MRGFLFVLALMMAAPLPAAAQVANGEAMAARMNRDYDYPWDPSDRQFLKMPPRDRIQRYERELIQYETNKRIQTKAQAKAQWLAMTPDEKRRFIQRNPRAFQPGGLYGDF
jgi:hypothetical protein